MLGGAILTGLEGEAGKGRIHILQMWRDRVKDK